MLKSRRYKMVLIRIIIGLVLIVGAYTYFRPVSGPDFAKLKQGSLEFNPSAIVYDKTNKVDIHSSNYDNLFKKIGVEEFLNYPLNQKCDLYFKNMYEAEPDWNNEPTKGFGFSRDIYKTYSEYRENVLKKFNENDENKESPQPSEDDIKADYEERWLQVKKEEQKIHDYISNLVIYNKCYVDNSVSHLDQDDLIKRVFPYLSGIHPEVEDYNLNRVIKHKDNPRHNHLRNMKANLKGKGLVLTLKDSHVDDTIRLIKLLRYLKNELPIEVIYWKNLSEAAKKALIDISRSRLVADEQILPVQDIYFLDVSVSITEEFQHKFEGFGNKVLATMFNTFEEMILLDADTILLIPPVNFFGMEKYQVNGTVFFKDRKAVEFRPPNDLMFFRKLIPSKFDSLVFDIGQPTNYSLSRSFFQGYNHYMESGLVVIDKRRHFFKSFVIAQLNFIYPVNARVYGDKELFWLSFVLMGDESYSFNKHFAAAIGEVTPDNERYKDIGRTKSFRGKELCSNHPAHINDEDDHTLLWFNSGFRFCGQPYDAEAEFKAKKRYTSLKTLESFKTFFDSKLVIKQAVIPPSIKVVSPGTNGEPDRSWLNLYQYCNGYTWCAYSSIGEETDEAKTGYVVNYSEHEIQYFSDLGDVWTGVKQMHASPVQLERLQLTAEDLTELKEAGVRQWWIEPS